MEAVAMWDFEATQPDEMSFKRGCRLCVITIEGGGWYRAMNDCQSGFIPSTYIKMEPNEWFQNPMTRSQAETILLRKDHTGHYDHPDGSFFIRKSESDVTGFALSVKHEDTVQHFKILTDSNNKFYIWPNSVFASINKLVQRYHTDNVSGDPNRVIHLKDFNPQLYEAMYDFAPANAEEIELKRGDVIRHVVKSDENWWEGEVNGNCGFFPKNYVREYNRHPQQQQFQ